MSAETEIKNLFNDNIIHIIPNHIKNRYINWKNVLSTMAKKNKHDIINHDMHIKILKRCIDEINESTLEYKDILLSLIHKDIETTRQKITKIEQEMKQHIASIKKITNDYEQGNYKYLDSFFGLEYYIDSTYSHRFE